MAINPYEAPQAEVERLASFRPRGLTRFLGIAIINLFIAAMSSIVVMPLLLYMAFWNYENNAVSLPMIYFPALICLSTVGLVTSAVGLLFDPKLGWLLTVGYCVPGLLVIVTVFIVTLSPLLLLGVPYPAIVLALLLSSSARQAAGLSRTGPKRRWKRRRRGRPRTIS